MLYAVFEDGSRQYRVSEGDVVKLDHRDAEVGARLEFSRVLLYRSDTDTQIGRPLPALDMPCFSSSRVVFMAFSSSG